MKKFNICNKPAYQNSTEINCIEYNNAYIIFDSLTDNKFLMSEKDWEYSTLYYDGEDYDSKNKELIILSSLQDQVLDK